MKAGARAPGSRVPHATISLLQAGACRALLTVLLGASTVAATGCAAGSGARSEWDRTADTAHVEIENNNWADVSVFAARYGDWRRLGTVVSMTTARFPLPQAWVDRAEPVVIRVEPIGNAEFFTSQEVPLEPGAVFRVNVKNYLAHSTLVIR